MVNHYFYMGDCSAKTIDRVLVVSEEDASLLVNRVIASLGDVRVGVVNYSQADAALGKETDLVILCWDSLTEQQALTLARRIRFYQHLNHISTVVLSSQADASKAEKDLRDYANAFVIKPFTFMELSSLVRAAKRNSKRSSVSRCRLALELLELHVQAPSLFYL